MVQPQLILLSVLSFNLFSLLTLFPPLLRRCSLTVQIFFFFFRLPSQNYETDSDYTVKFEVNIK